jgi:hypothetical protein
MFLLMYRQPFMKEESLIFFNKRMKRKRTIQFDCLKRNEVALYSMEIISGGVWYENKVIDQMSLFSFIFSGRLKSFGIKLIKQSDLLFDVWKREFLRKECFMIRKYVRKVAQSSQNICSANPVSTKSSWKIKRTLVAWG